MKNISFLFGVAVLMIATTAFALVKLKARETLGAPGVKLGIGQVEYPDGTIVQTNIVALPEVQGYASKAVPVTKIELTSLPSDTTFGRKNYTAEDGFQCFVSVVLMGSDRTSIHPPQYCLVGQGWNIDSTEQTTVPITQPCSYDLPVMKLITTKEATDANGNKVSGRGIYVYWFVTDHQLTANHSERMFNMAIKRLKTGVLDRWAYIACFSTCLPGDEDATYERMRSFIAASIPHFQLTSGCAGRPIAFK